MENCTSLLCLSIILVALVEYFIQVLLNLNTKTYIWLFFVTNLKQISILKNPKTSLLSFSGVTNLCSTQCTYFYLSIVSGYRFVHVHHQTSSQQGSHTETEMTNC